MRVTYPGVARLRLGEHSLMDAPERVVNCSR